MEPTLNNFLLLSRFFLEPKVLSQDVSEIVKITNLCRDNLSPWSSKPHAEGGQGGELFIIFCEPILQNLFTVDVLL